MASLASTDMGSSRPKQRRGADAAAPAEKSASTGRSRSPASGTLKSRKVSSSGRDADAPSAGAAPPPLSAVAARKLAREQQQAKLDSQSVQRLVSSTLPSAGSAGTSQASVPPDQPPEGSTTLQNSDTSQDGLDSEQEDEDEVEPVASTSKALDRPPKRYFLGGSNAPSPSATVTTTEDVEDTTFMSQPDEPDSSRARTRSPSVSSTKRIPSKRRRRNDPANFFLDSFCKSTWKIEPDNHRTGSRHADGPESMVIGMYPGETLVMRGTCVIEVVRGAITVDSATVNARSGPIPFFAPTTHALPFVRAIRGNGEFIKSTQDVSFMDDIETLDHPVLVALTSLHSGIEGIEAVCRIAGMPLPPTGMWHVASRWPATITTSTPRTYKILSEAERDLCATVVPHDWHQAIEACSKSNNDSLTNQEAGRHTVHIVQGPKGTGKSTFAKFLLNKLLSQHGSVAYLDCDLGQPEFTPSGFVSLTLVDRPVIGPSFTHLAKKVITQHYIGAATPKNDPEAYLAAIAHLLGQYTSGEVTTPDGLPPLVINTQGWYKGLGADLLLEIHRLATPTECYDFSGPSTSQQGLDADSPVSTAVVASSETEVIILQPFTPPENGPPRLTAADLRTLQLASYFHMQASSFTDQKRSPQWDFSEVLVAKRPYNVPWASLSAVKLAISEHVSPEDILRILDVSVAALQAHETIADQQATDSLAATYVRTLQEPVDISSTRTIGLGIIRSIDVQQRTLHILSPMPQALLERVNGITKGEIELPTALMVDYVTPDDETDEGGLCGVEWKNVPYLEQAGSMSAGVGHARRRVRRNVMRRSQFK